MAIKTIEELIERIKEFDANKEVVKFLYDDDVGIKWFNHTTDEFEDDASLDLKILVEELLTGFDQLLIRNDGQHNPQNRKKVVEAGFRFAKGEEDSFGPLTSVIVLTNFRICYG